MSIVTIPSLYLPLIRAFRIHSDNPGSFLHLKTLSLITCSKILFPYMVAAIPGLLITIILRVWIQPTGSQWSFELVVAANPYSNPSLTHVLGSWDPQPRDSISTDAEIWPQHRRRERAGTWRRWCLNWTPPLSCLYELPSWRRQTGPESRLNEGEACDCVWCGCSLTSMASYPFSISAFANSPGKERRQCNAREIASPATSAMCACKCPQSSEKTLGPLKLELREFVKPI